jgi:hypothetical protein
MTVIKNNDEGNKNIKINVAELNVRMPVMIT